MALHLITLLSQLPLNHFTILFILKLAYPFDIVMANHKTSLAITVYQFDHSSTLNLFTSFYIGGHCLHNYLYLECYLMDCWIQYLALSNWKSFISLSSPILIQLVLYFLHLILYSAWLLFITNCMLSYIGRYYTFAVTLQNGSQFQNWILSPLKV